MELLKCVPIKSDHHLKTDHKSPYAEQIQNVNEIILKTGIFSSLAIQAMTKHYYQDLNMHSMYFDITSPDLISRHILALMMSQQLEIISKKKKGIHLATEYEGQPIYLTSSEFVKSAYTEIQEKIKTISIQQAVQLQIHRSFGSEVSLGKHNLEIFQL